MPLFTKHSGRRFFATFSIVTSKRRRNGLVFVSILALLLVEWRYSPGFYVVNNTPAWLCRGRCRPNRCEGCFSHDFEALIQNESICENSSSSSIDLMIVITSVHNQHARRDVLRKTWLSISRGNSANVRYAFLLGTSEDNTSMQMVYEESRIHGDILMDNFVDSYLNLTLKTIMGIKWAARYCSQARFFMKTDQDMWVNVPKMLDALEARSEELQHSVGGSCFTALPFRLPFSKWYTTYTNYPYVVYPKYCSGVCYVTSMTVAMEINSNYANIPFFKWEDVYIALCLQQLGLGVTDMVGFYTDAVEQEFDPCKMQSDFLILHGASSELLNEYMNASSCLSNK